MKASPNSNVNTDRSKNANAYFVRGSLEKEMGRTGFTVFLRKNINNDLKNQFRRDGFLGRKKSDRELFKPRKKVFTSMCASLQGSIALC